MLFLQKDILHVEDQEEKKEEIPHIPPAVLLQRSLCSGKSAQEIAKDFVQIKITLPKNYIALLLKQVFEFCLQGYFLAPFCCSKDSTIPCTDGCTSEGIFASSVGAKSLSFYDNHLSRIFHSNYDMPKKSTLSLSPKQTSIILHTTDFKKFGEKNR